MLRRKSRFNSPTEQRSLEATTAQRRYLPTKETRALGMSRFSSRSRLAFLFALVSLRENFCSVSPAHHFPFGAVSRSAWRRSTLTRLLTPRAQHMVPLTSTVQRENSNAPRIPEGKLKSASHTRATR